MEREDVILDKIRAEIKKKYPSCQCTGELTGYAEAVEDFLQILDKHKESEHKRTIDADELLRRIAEKAKTPSLSEDTVNGLCGATAIIYDMLIESGQDDKSEIKVGDKVRTLKDKNKRGHELFPIGTIGTVVHIRENSIHPYLVSANNESWFYSSDMLEMVDD